MERLTLAPRPDWQQRVESVGLLYHTIDGETYWDESACYRFSVAEIDELERAGNELQRISLEAVERVIRDNLFGQLRIPEKFVPYIINSWDMDDPCIYGRFDLVYDGTKAPKLLEYNADTPTSLLEASVAQWFWMKEVFPDGDQFNSIHEKLIDCWRTWPYLKDGTFHFACADGSAEDLGNTEYLRDTAIQAGLATNRLFVEEIGWDVAANCFVDLDDRPISTLFKLYPWEWLVHEEFGLNLLKNSMRLIEPPWKMILSNKGILPILWNMFEGHPNLLPAFFAEGRLTGDYVRKPLFSREGENIRIVRSGSILESPGSYGSEGYVCQAFASMPCYDGNYPVVGCWIIGSEAAGIGIREDRSEITTNSSRFIPHYFQED